MDYQKSNIFDLLEKSGKNSLVLPNFQRDFVWDLEKQKLLLASFLVSLPIGNFLILEGKSGDFICKELCYLRRATPTDNCYYLLDGQQRLSTIKNTFMDQFGFEGWEEQFNDLQSKLRQRWYIDLNEKCSRDFLGFDDLRFKTEAFGSSVAKLQIKEPSEILDGIKYHTIHKTKNRDKFYHPAYSYHSTSLYDRKLELAGLYATNRQIPLFDFLSDDKAIIKQCLKQLANTKLESLINEIRLDDSLATKYLGHLDADIQEKFRSKKTTEITRVWDNLKDRWVEDLMDYFKDLFKVEMMIPAVKSNELSRATSVFEYMNKGGTPLDTFDIVVAKYADVSAEKTLYDKLDDCAKQEFDIPESVSNVQETINFSCENSNIFNNERLIKPVKELFLNFLSLISKIKETSNPQELDVTYIKKERILSLTQSQINEALPDACKALVRSLAFVEFRCGIHNFNYIGYNLMLIPIGILLMEDTRWNDRFVNNKIEYWYWTSLFSGRFREKQNQRAISEAKELFNWAVNSDLSDELKNRMNSIFSDTNYSDKETLLLENEDKAVPSAIHNGILQYVLSLRPNDFVTENDSKLRAWELAKNGIALNDHHIIPLGSATTLGESSKKLRADKTNILNSPLNRTFISQKANGAINNLSPIRYLPLLNQAVQYSHCLGWNRFENIELDAAKTKEFLEARFGAISGQLQRELTELRGI